MPRFIYLCSWACFVAAPQLGSHLAAQTGADTTALVTPTARTSDGTDASGVPREVDAADVRGAAGTTLRPGDVIRLKIWREPDFSGDYTIDETGTAVFPRLGPVRVGAVTVDSLKRLLVSSYATYLVNPSIEVIALRRVNVLGAVRTPGLYQVDATMTVADVLALAGGVANDGRTDRIQLIRDGRRIQTNLAEGTRLADTPIRSGDQLYVPQRSWLSRNVGIIAAGITAAGVIAAGAIN